LLELLNLLLLSLLSFCYFRLITTHTILVS
jgi:hypothetical protein